MSREGDLRSTLPCLLRQYNASSHKAIIETFMLTIEDHWDDVEISEFLDAGLGYSVEADEEIKQQRALYCKE